MCASLLISRERERIYSSMTIHFAFVSSHLSSFVRLVQRFSNTHSLPLHTFSITRLLYRIRVGPERIKTLLCLITVAEELSIMVDRGCLSEVARMIRRWMLEMRGKGQDCRQFSSRTLVGWRQNYTLRAYINRLVKTQTFLTIPFMHRSISVML